LLLASSIAMQRGRHPIVVGLELALPKLGRDAPRKRPQRSWRTLDLLETTRRRTVEANNTNVFLLPLRLVFQLR
jgi:hypothetical protein